MPSSPVSDLTANLRDVLARIAKARNEAIAPAAQTKLVAVSKGHGAEAIAAVLAAGHRLFGENRVQELLSKQPALPSSVRWHLIGHLQSNKVRKVLPVVEAIHSVDSIDLARDINRIAAELGQFPKVYLEVNVAGEASKHGFAPDKLEAGLEELLALDRLEIQGLMCVPPISKEPEESRKHFVFLREYRDKLEKEAGVPFSALSMGMSGDYEIAVEEGATVVRVGSAIFGGR